MIDQAGNPVIAGGSLTMENQPAAMTSVDFKDRNMGSHNQS